MTIKPRTIERVYCLAHCADGRWLLLNRRYKPYGQPRTRDWIDYDSCDGLRVWLRDRDLRNVDGGSTPYRQRDGMIWLFNDGTDPDRNAWNRAAYQRRLAIVTDAFDEVAA